MTVFNRGKSLMASIRASISKLAGSIIRPKSKPASAGASQATPAFANDLYDASFTAGGGNSASSVNDLLVKATSEMRTRKDDLEKIARLLKNELKQRREGAASILAQAIRMGIGVIGLGIAGLIYLEVKNASPAGIPNLAADLSTGDAAQLSRIFMFVSAFIAGIALLVSSLLKFNGKLDNNDVSQQALKLGKEIVKNARDFDFRLDTLRQKMNKREAEVDAVSDLNQAYVLAVEARYYFDNIPFLMEQNDDDAVLLLKKFLRSNNPLPVPAGAVFLLGFFLGALMMSVATGVQPAITLPNLSNVLMPQWAAYTLVFGAMTSVMAGAVIGILTEPISEYAMPKAHEDALKAMRSAFITGDAPSPADLVYRIVDAVDVFRARVQGQQRGTNQTAAVKMPGGSFSTDHSGSSVWRRPDSAVKFVDAGFQSSPEGWRTDAYEKKLSPKPEAKRGRDKAKKAPRD